MTEAEYIMATNRVKITIAITVLREVLTGNEWGVYPAPMLDVLKNLSGMEERLFGLVKTKD